MFLINLASLCLVQLHIFWTLVQDFRSKFPRKGLLEVKRLCKFRFFGSFSIAKTEECDLKVWNVFDQFGITIPCSATYFLEVGARVLLKVAAKELFFSRKKRRSATKKLEMFLINLALLYLVQLHIFWKSVYAFHWK